MAKYQSSASSMLCGCGIYVLAYVLSIQYHNIKVVEEQKNRLIWAFFAFVFHLFRNVEDGVFVCFFFIVVARTLRLVCLNDNMNNQVGEYAEEI